jgi:lipopolysaccharide heptosyltransferase II
MKLLLIRFSSVGDVVLTTPLVRALRDALPDAVIHFATRPPYAPLLESNPRIDRVLTLPGSDAAALRDFAVTLRRERYDRVLDLHGTLRARALRLLVPTPRWSRYPKATLRRWSMVRLRHRPDPARVVPVAERYFGAARDLGVRPDGRPPEVFPTPRATEQAHDALRAAGFADGETFVAFAPGARHATKCWPEDRWIDLGRALARDGIRSVLLGGPEDAPLAHRIAAEVPGAASLAGALDLLASAAVLARADRLVSGDTGVMHLATAVGTPVVALFGPTVRGFGFFPYADNATILERDLPCRPCSTHGGAACPLGHHDCLRGIRTEEVLHAIGTRRPVG